MNSRHLWRRKAHKPGSATIALNKRARHEYFIEEEFEAGLALQGWEVKSLRAGKANIGDSYVILKDGEAWLFGANFTPMAVASTHVVCDPTRTRKLLLNQRELDSLYGRINREGYTVVALSLYWKNAWCKVKIGVAKGKNNMINVPILKNVSGNWIKHALWKMQADNRHFLWPASQYEAGQYSYLMHASKIYSLCLTLINSNNYRTTTRIYSLFKNFYSLITQYFKWFL